MWKHSIFLVPAVAAANLGHWGPTLQFPIVPVAGFVEPASGQLVVWSAYTNDSFEVGATVTQTAVYNPSTGSVQEFPVANVGHDMFCPGISYDFNGNVLVTGGDTPAATSLFHQGQWQWTQQQNMTIPRGYQASATLSGGQIFVIGGSWSGGLGGKNGEVWSGNSWTYLPGALVGPLLTNDTGGIFRQDNHAWLFASSNNSIIQLGPSINMNWYSVQGQGKVSPAGKRSGGDAMCGPAVMFDATQGQVLAVGGSPNYENTLATANARLLTIGKVGAPIKVKTLSPMNHRRIFANSVVLPDGTVFVVGGQSYGTPFYDGNSSMVPEIWSPVTQQFTPVAVGPTPRNYHSIALLMPNGTVFSGGGGLCGDCGDRNHPDGQLYSPPYLFQSNGKTPAVRPQITNLSTKTLKVGGTIQATLNSGATGPITFSMIRMGTSTHTVNTDQRRVPLTAQSNGGSYSMTVPADPGVLLPGYWYFFALANGVPSVAQIIQVVP